MDLFADGLPGNRTGDPAPEPEQSPPPVRAPRAGDPLDLGDWDAPAPRSTSRRWMLLAASAPWIVVVAILMTGPRSPGTSAPAASSPAPTTPDVASEPTTAPTTATAPAATESAAPPTPEAAPEITMTGGTGPTTRGEAVGLAAVVARSWLSTRPPGVDVEGLEPAPGADGHYVEHLVVESLDHPARGALVVTVRALVLPVEGDAYGEGQQVRLAVPISLDADRARPAGTPWPLASDDLGVQVPTTAPVDDPDLMTAAAEAVTAAGYRDVALTALERTSGWAWIAHVEARAPGHEGVAAHAIWLRSDVGRLVVAGTTPPPPADPPGAAPTEGHSSPAPQPTTEVTP